MEDTFGNLTNLHLALCGQISYNRNKQLEQLDFLEIVVWKRRWQMAGTKS